MKIRLRWLFIVLSLVASIYQAPAQPNNQGLADWQAKLAKMWAPKHLATWSEATVTIPSSAFTDAGQAGGVTAAKLWKRVVLIGCGATLQSYDLDANSIHEVGLPMKLTNSISSIEAEPGVLWLGTGGGLIRVSLSDGAVREFNEKDGFPTPIVTDLRLVGGRLFIGFNPGFGYLDTGSGKFTGLLGTFDRYQSWLQANQAPPTSYIHAITTYDGNSFWITSQHAFQHFDFGLNKWTPATSEDVFKETGVLSDAQVSCNAKFAVAQNFRHCISRCELPGTNWESVSLQTNSQGFEASAVALDPADPDWAWIGNDNGAMTLLDLATFKVVANGEIPKSGFGSVRWIFPLADKVLFIIEDHQDHCSLYSLDKSALLGSNPAARAAGLNEITNLAAMSEHPLKITQNPGLIATLDDGPITACAPGQAFGNGRLLVACGTNLNSFDWSGVFGFGSGTEFEKVALPLTVKDPITAIASDDQDLWLGTDGGGLIRIPQSGAAPTILNEKDGFPMSSIRSLALIPGRLLIGFGRGIDGSFGYLDTSTQKFTGAKPSGISLKTAEESLQPPPQHSVWQMKSNDSTNTFWIACDSALYRLALDTQQWSLQLPSPDLPDHPLVGGPKTLTACSNCVAAAMSSGGFAICNVADDRWTHLNLSTNRSDNEVTTLSIDVARPNYLWLGGHGKITLWDTDTQKIIYLYRQAFRDGPIVFMVIYPGDIFFIEEGNGAHELFHVDNPAYKGP